MNEFMEIPAAGDLPQNAADAAVSEAMEQIRLSNDLTGDDMSWIEKLFHSITAPFTDIFEQFKPGYDTERIFPGAQTDTAAEAAKEYEIDKAADQWHMQAGDNSCAVCSQQFIINEFLQLDLTEAQLCTIAEANNWFDPEGGTTPEDSDNLLQLFGIETHIQYEATLADLKQTLDNGGRAIVGVDGMVLWVDGAGNYPVYGADHAIEVIGIDESDGADVKVIINDSGAPNGCGRAVPLNEFMEAWLPSGGFMVGAYPKD